jgi:hypothetical protein
VVNEVMPAINSVESRVTGGLDEDEKEMLARLLRKVLRSVEELDER